MWGLEFRTRGGAGNSQRLESKNDWEEESLGFRGKARGFRFQGSGLKLWGSLAISGSRA